jgi:hypothetical protein
VGQAIVAVGQRRRRDHDAAHGHQADRGAHRPAPDLAPALAIVGELAGDHVVVGQRRLGVVAGVVDRGDQRGDVGHRRIDRQVGGPGHQVDGDVVDPGATAQGLLDVALAGRAGHAADRERDRRRIGHRYSTRAG